MKLPPKVEERFRKFYKKMVIGDCFAGGTFKDNENQKMFTAGYKDGVSDAKWKIKDNFKNFLAQELSKRDELAINTIKTIRKQFSVAISEMESAREVEIYLDKYFVDILKDIKSNIIK